MARDALIRTALRHGASAGFAASLVACLAAAACLRVAGGDAPGFLPPPPTPGLLPPPPPLLIQSGPPPQTTPVVQAAASSPDKKQGPKRATNDNCRRRDRCPVPSRLTRCPCGPRRRSARRRDRPQKSKRSTLSSWTGASIRDHPGRGGRPADAARPQEKPNKVQLPDEKIAAYELISANGTGGDRQGHRLHRAQPLVPRPEGRREEKILSYLVHVVPDPEVCERREACFLRLQDEINRKFPDSVVRLTLLNDKLLVCGQAKDGFEAQQILRVVGVNAGQPPAVVADHGQPQRRERQRAGRTAAAAGRPGGSTSSKPPPAKSTPSSTSCTSRATSRCCCA